MGPIKNGLRPDVELDPPYGPQPLFKASWHGAAVSAAHNCVKLARFDICQPNPRFLTAARRPCRAGGWSDGELSSESGPAIAIMPSSGYHRTNQRGGNRRHRPQQRASRLPSLQRAGRAAADGSAEFRSCARGCSERTLKRFEKILACRHVSKHYVRKLGAESTLIIRNMRLIF